MATTPSRTLSSATQPVRSALKNPGTSRLTSRSAVSVSRTLIAAMST